MVEDIDRDLHKGESDIQVVRYADFKAFDKAKTDEMSAECGEECWLQVVAFDVLYVAGPDADELFSQTLSDEVALPDIGSITHLSGFERKRVLYKLIEPQKNKVEIVQSLVIRPNGNCVQAENYFSASNPIMECGLPVYLLDSAKWTLNIGHKSLKEFDEARRLGRTDIDISRRRTHFVNHHYHSIVEEQKLEGLVFKDLAAPYILRSHTKWWLKIKPDYSSDSFASDLDVVVIGACWAAGVRASGELSSFLCGCVDSKDESKFFTFCRINARSLKEGKLGEIMNHTGFKKATATEPVSFGKWFTEDEHGKTLPDFISTRSFQDGEEDDRGWRWTRNSYPDLFIKPEDSVVVTLNASEIVPSDEYSAGVTLRFPRASRLRLGEDEKPANEVENEETLYRLLRQYEDKRSHMARSSNNERAVELASPSKGQSQQIHDSIILARFHTLEQYRRSLKDRNNKRRKDSGRLPTLSLIKKESNALTGLKFYVLEGTYSFDPDSIDAEVAKGEGWFNEATCIHQAIDVMAFIKKHNGRIFRSTGFDVRVIGGSTMDFKVKNMIRGYDIERDRGKKKRKKDSSQASSDANVPGVLKWTYVLSVVYRWFNIKEAQKQKIMLESGYSSEDDEDDEMECIENTIPGILQPRFFDFLAQSEDYGDDPVEAVWRHGKLDATSMKRATVFLQDSKARLSKRRKPPLELEDSLHWHQAGLLGLGDEDRWVLSCQFENLWPYRKANGESNEKKEKSGCVCDNPSLWFLDSDLDGGAVIVYADLFGDNFGLKEKDDAYGDDRNDDRWKNLAFDVKMGGLASSLPLLRSMGAIVTCHLHNFTTHILCDLVLEKEYALWKPGDTVENLFRNKHHGQKLSERLEKMLDRPILLVSRGWVFSKWN